MTLSQDADYPECAGCETNVLVARDTGIYDWHCHACGRRWRTGARHDGRLV